MKKLFTLLSLIALTGFGQTIKFTQLEKAAGIGRYIVTNSSGTMTYTTAIPVSVVSGITATAPLFYSAGTFTIQPASGSQPGALSAADYAVFNSKEPAITTGTTLQYWRGDKTFQTLNTAIVPELTNLYYTQTRFNTAFAAKTTADLTENTNLYFTNARAISATSGSYEAPLTFSTGLTRSTNTITNNLLVGVSGGQTIIGGTAVGDGLTYKGTTGNGTTTVSAHTFNVGNNGATTGMIMYNSGDLNIGNKTNTSQRLVRIGQNTAWMDIGSLVGATSMPAIYLGVTTPAIDNYAISGTGGPLYLNAGTAATTVEMRVMNVQKYIVGQTTHSWLSTGATSNSNPVYSFVTPASTGQTAATETNGFLFDMATNSIQHAGNTTITINRDAYFKGRTHTFATAGGGVIADGFTLYSESPIAGTNTSATSRLWAAGFNGRVAVGTNIYIGGMTTAATALVQLAAGTATASTSPLKFTSGINLTALENGAVEYDGSDLFITANSTRQIISKGKSGSVSQVGTATTTFTVTFGGTQPNSTYKVQVTPTNILSAALFYVTNKTATTFDVVYMAGLTGTVTFDWQLTQ